MTFVLSLEMARSVEAQEELVNSGHLSVGKFVEQKDAGHAADNSNNNNMTTQRLCVASTRTGEHPLRGSYPSETPACAEPSSPHFSRVHGGMEQRVSSRRCDPCRRGTLIVA